MIEVLIKHIDCDLFRAGLSALLNASDDITVCADATRQPDVIVGSGPVTEVGIPWVAFLSSANEEARTIRNALTAGVRGVITERMTGDCQVQVVRCAAAGATAIPSELLVDVLARTAEPPRRLTDTEATMLRIAAIDSVAAAGVALGFSRRQSQRRFSSLCAELGIGSHREAIVAAARWGLL